MKREGWNKKPKSNGKSQKTSKANQIAPHSPQANLYLASVWSANHVQTHALCSLLQLLLSITKSYGIKYLTVTTDLTPSQSGPAQGNHPWPVCETTGIIADLCHIDVISHYMNHLMTFRILLEWQAWRCSRISPSRFIYISGNNVLDIMVSRQQTWKLKDVLKPSTKHLQKLSFFILLSNIG